MGPNWDTWIWQTARDIADGSESVDLDRLAKTLTGDVTDYREGPIPVILVSDGFATPWAALRSVAEAAARSALREAVVALERLDTVEHYPEDRDEVYQTVYTEWCQSMDPVASVDDDSKGAARGKLSGMLSADELAEVLEYWPEPEQNEPAE